MGTYGYVDTCRYEDTCGDVCVHVSMWIRVDMRVHVGTCRYEGTCGYVYVHVSMWIRVDMRVYVAIGTSGYVGT